MQSPCTEAQNQHDSVTCGVPCQGEGYWKQGYHISAEEDFEMTVLLPATLQTLALYAHPEVGLLFQEVAGNPAAHGTGGNHPSRQGQDLPQPGHGRYPVGRTYTANPVHRARGSRPPGCRKREWLPVKEGTQDTRNTERRAFAINPPLDTMARFIPDPATGQCAPIRSFLFVASWGEGLPNPDLKVRPRIRPTFGVCSRLQTPPLRPPASVATQHERTKGA